MTQRTNGMPELKYSEEVFREMYEALKLSYEYLRDLGILPNLGGLARERAQKALAKADGK